MLKQRNSRNHFPHFMIEEPVKRGKQKSRWSQKANDKDQSKEENWHTE